MASVSGWPSGQACHCSEESQRPHETLRFSECANAQLTVCFIPEVTSYTSNASICVITIKSSQPCFNTSENRFHHEGIEHCYSKRHVVELVGSFLEGIGMALNRGDTGETGRECVLSCLCPVDLVAYLFLQDITIPREFFCSLSEIEILHK